MSSDTHSDYGTTVPNTPEPEPEPDVSPDFCFADLIPLNSSAANAIPASSATSYHDQFISKCDHEGERKPCYTISLSSLPEQAGIGWRIGKGRDQIENAGVELLLKPSMDFADKVAGIHARFHWEKGAAGFLITADNRRGKFVRLNGERLENGASKVVPPNNMIGIGECLFTLRFRERDDMEQEQFDAELAKFMRIFCDDKHPYILPTPRDNDVSFGEWKIQWSISRGGHGVVFYVTHARDGTPAAAKQLLRTGRNEASFETELEMSRRLLDMKHPNVASPIEIHRQQSRTNTDTLRLRSILGDAWQPSYQDIRDEYFIISPLASTTLSYICENPLRFHMDLIVDAYSQVFSGIEYLHGHGIKHGDMKPQNILISSLEPVRVAITDFGCAAVGEAMEFNAVGTLMYMAPEQVEGKTHDRAIDQWAMGVMAAQLMNFKIKGRVWQDSEEYRQILAKEKYRRDFVLMDCCIALLELEPRNRMTPSAAIKRLGEHIKTDTKGLASTGSKRRANAEGTI